jgi:hypothetical protein
MLIPQYWAEARARHRQGNRQITIRRFGWSDISQNDAYAMAEARATEALRRAISGERLTRREPRVAYNGADGLPIREEIVERFGQVVITRNSYGARCLNTPNVLFADVDVAAPSPIWLAVLSTLVAAAAGVAVYQRFASYVAALVVFGVGYTIINAMAHLVYNRLDQHGDRRVRRARERIARFVDAHPGWAVRIYRTPSGLRAMATHRLFTPGDPVVREFFAAIGVDPVYARMCENQQCFRARLSPKPWRIGVTKHIKPRRGAWPVPPETRPAREAWIAAYETASRGYATCRFLEAVGSGAVNIDAEIVRRFHDDACRALDERLPLA